MDFVSGSKMFLINSTGQDTRDKLLLCTQDQSWITRLEIVLEGIAGGAKSDIAIDDISLNYGMCSLDCDFESDICNWKQNRDDSFDWIRNCGATVSPDTGPLADHTTGEGCYIYIETSYPRMRGDKAKLSSPVQEPGIYCLLFWYSMYGQHVNRLNVYAKTNEGNETLIYSNENSTGSVAWKKTMIGYETTFEHQIVLEGVRGDGNQGDIAVDDISMSHGDCLAESTTTTKRLQSITSESTTNATVTFTLHPQLTTETNASHIVTAVSEETFYSSPSTSKITNPEIDRVDTVTKQTTTVTTKMTTKTKNTPSAGTTINNNEFSTDKTLTDIPTSMKMSTMLLHKSFIQNMSSYSTFTWTKTAKQTTNISEPTYFSTAYNVTRTYTTTIRSSRNTNYKSEETQSSSKLSNLTTVSVLPSSRLPQYNITITPLHDKSSESKESSISGIYIMFTSISAVLLVMMISLFIFMCRMRSQLILRLQTGSKSDETTEDIDLERVNEVYVRNILDDITNDTNSEVTGQDQYSVVSLDNIKTTDMDENEYSTTWYKRGEKEEVDRENHIYSHFQEHSPFIDAAYSHSLAIADNKNAGQSVHGSENTSDVQGPCSEDTYIISGRELLREKNTSNCDYDTDDMYDHIVTGSKSKTTDEVDGYAHLYQVKNRQQRSDQSYGYTCVSKKNNKTDCMFNISEETDKNIAPEQQTQSLENSSRDSLLNEKDNFDHIKDSYHAYFVLEKEDSCSTL